MPGVRVKARSAENGEPVAGATTAADGRYQMAGLASGRIILSAYRAGHYTRIAAGRSASQIPLDCVVTQRYPHNDFELVRGEVITGRVVDELGEPVQGVTVGLVRATYSEPTLNRIVSSSDLTDDRGVFRIAGLQPGTYALTARPADTVYNYEADTKTVEVTANHETSRTTITLRRLPLFPVSGRVAGTEGPPDAQTMLLLERLGGPERKVSVPVRENGSFDLRLLPTGEYRLSALVSQQDDRGQKKLSLGVIDVQGEIAGLLLHPSPEGAVEGIVRVVSGDSPARFRLIFSSVEGRDSRSIRVAAPDFHFEIPDLPPGTYDIRAAASDVYLKGIASGNNVLPTRNISVSSGGLTKLEILAGADYAKVSGRVSRRGGGALPHARVALDGASRVRSQQADQNGVFLFMRVVPGEYRICAWSDLRPELVGVEASWARAGCSEKIVTIKPDSEVEIDLTAAP